MVYLFFFWEPDWSWKNIEKGYQAQGEKPDHIQPPPDAGGTARPAPPTRIEVTIQERKDN